MGEDYIVEYSVGSFQRGSVVLRFDKDPTKKELVAALGAYGVDQQKIRRPSMSGWGIVKALILLIPLFYAGSTSWSDEAFRQGLYAGLDVITDRSDETSCFGELKEAGVEKPLLDAVLSKEPTAFPFTPANAAFLNGCFRSGF